MRTLVDIPDQDIEWLDRRAAETGRSRAALVREAIAAFRAEARNQGIEAYFGLWKDRPEIGDGLAFQRRLRGEGDDA